MTTAYPDLSDAQQTALDALLKGETVTNAAKLAGVARQTVSEWKNDRNGAFKKALDYAAWDGFQTVSVRTNALVLSALAVLQRDLQGNDLAAQRRAANAILRWAANAPTPPPMNADQLADAEWGKALNEAFDAAFAEPIDPIGPAGEPLATRQIGPGARSRARPRA